MEKPIFIDFLPTVNRWLLRYIRWVQLLVVFSVGSFAAGLGEMFRRIPLGTFSAGLGAMAGLIYSGIDVYETAQRVRRGKATANDFHLSLANLGLASVPTAVFGATMFGLTATPLALAAAGAATIGAMGLGGYRGWEVI